MSGYDPEFFALLDEVEDRHFWFRARRRAVKVVAQRAARGLQAPYRVLELGCGTGGMLRLLAQACPGAQVIGMDLYAQGLAHARRRAGCPLVQADLRWPPFTTPFDIVAMFDVLEHLEMDVDVLRQARTMMSPGGAFLVTVPAHPALWSYFDEASKHVRRYTPTTLRAALEGAGLRVEYMSQFMSAIFPLVWLKRRSMKSGQSAEQASRAAESELRIRPGLNAILNAALAPETLALRLGCRLPVGTSLVALARN